MALLLVVVRLTVDLPDEHLKAGDVGTIVHVFDAPDVAYEVESCDSQGCT
jgi:hypothetical protein